MGAFQLKLGIRVWATVLLAAGAVPASALTTFAQFNQSTPTDIVTYTDMGASAAFTLVPSAVIFDILGWGPIGSYNVTMTGSAMSNSSAVINGNIGTRDGWNGTFSFDDGGTNYLTVTFTNALLFGVIGGSTAGFLASEPGATITLSSDVIDVSMFNLEGFSLGITGLEPSYGSGSGPYMGALTGGFSAGLVPEPASWALLITGFGLVGFAARRRAPAGA